MKVHALSRQPAFVYFWLGVLTGALIVMASLMIRSYADNGAASVVGRTNVVAPAALAPNRVSAPATKSFGPQSAGSTQGFGPQSFGPQSFGPQSAGK